MTAFSLKQYENQIPGVRYRDGNLRLRPTWAATALDLYGMGVGVFVAAIGVWSRSILPVVGGAAVFLLGLPYLRCRVVCAGRTVLVVNKWRSVMLDVGDISATSVANFRPAWFIPFREPGTLWPRTLAACSLSRRDGSSLRCDALVGLPHDDNVKEPSPIESKAAILQRWIEAGATASTETP